jgi:hypothetical protein
MSGASVADERLLSSPITGSGRCCARAASDQAAAHKGAAGIDGMSFEALGPYLKEHWPTHVASLDDLVGTQQEGAESLRASAVVSDNELELGRLLHRQIGCLCSLENFIDILSQAPEQACNWRRKRAAHLHR